jgi:ATP-dependent helicase/nuclease subunit B
MFSPTEHRLFGLPPGVDFPKAVVCGLKSRLRDAPPEAMARVTLYVNTDRMRLRMIEAFGAAGPGLLPRLRLVTDRACCLSAKAALAAGPND